MSFTVTLEALIGDWRKLLSGWAASGQITAAGRLSSWMGSQSPFRSWWDSGASTIFHGNYLLVYARRSGIASCMTGYC
jgi:hypothetical protein